MPYYEDYHCFKWVVDWKEFDRKYGHLSYSKQSKLRDRWVKKCRKKNGEI